MKVLLTGCSSPQSSKKLNSRVPTFMGLIRMGLVGSGHDVDWLEPSINMTEYDLKEYDVVVIGLTSPTSLSAYRLYGALSVAERAKKVTNVRYLVDAPEPEKLWKGIRAIAKNPKNLVKDFYSSRSEFYFATELNELSRLQEMILSLYEDKWEKTIFPSFPWVTKNQITRYIPNLSDDSIDLLCLDSFVFNTIEKSIGKSKNNSNFWSVDVKTPWSNKLEKTLSKKVDLMISSKWDNNSKILENINDSIGSIISIYKNDEPWWSINLSQSLIMDTPVVSEWRYTSFMDDSWSVLGTNVEEMSLVDRTNLANKQKIAYLQTIPVVDDAVDRVLSAVFTE